MSNIIRVFEALTSPGQEDPLRRLQISPSSTFDEETIDKGTQKTPRASTSDGNVELDTPADPPILVKLFCPDSDFPICSNEACGGPRANSAVVGKDGRYCLICANHWFVYSELPTAEEKGDWKRNVKDDERKGYVKCVRCHVHMYVYPRPGPTESATRPNANCWERNDDGEILCIQCYNDAIEEKEAKDGKAMQEEQGTEEPWVEVVIDGEDVKTNSEPVFL